MRDTVEIVLGAALLLLIGVFYAMWAMRWPLALIVSVFIFAKVTA